MKQKKIPVRMCVVCRNSKPKNDMIRIVKDAEGKVYVDSTKKRAGRGFYICKSKECIDMCKAKKILNKALKTNINNDLYAMIEDEYSKD